SIESNRVTYEMDHAVKARLRYLQLDDFAVEKIAGERTANGHHVNGAERRNEHGVQGNGQGRAFSRVILPLAPAHLEIVGVGEVTARRPGCFRNVARAYGQPAVIMVSDHEDAARVCWRRVPPEADLVV